MAKFKIEVTVELKGLRKEKLDQAVGAAISAVHGVVGIGANIRTSTTKVNTNPSRADRLADANEAKSMAQEILSELADELEERRDNFPENLQSGDKFSQVETAADALRQAADDIENVDLDSIEMPGF